MYRLSPRPFLSCEAFATKPGEAAWNTVELTPERRSSRPRAKTEFTLPIKLIRVAVIPGARITKKRAPFLSAMYPMRGLNMEGSLERLVNEPAIVRFMER
jgi:hypothetical protein